ncbi:TPA: hypothetical protein N0F65_006478 [Lagenidium giganteum]|uniref:Nuclear control of ATPase protein 2 n=1 Tax=Lagenidium giganteum TaxID=4803 RepID=A0AAV2YT62_9STRA|nr:TPA: hypothetical protein N0F65_006478 [Lagenidium giganteum]
MGAMCEKIIAQLNPRWQKRIMLRTTPTGASSLALALSTDFATIQTLRELESLAQKTADASTHAEVVAEALGAVAATHSPASPTASAAAISTALDRVQGVLQHFQLYARHSERQFDAKQQDVLDAGVTRLWGNVVMYELHLALSDLVRTVDFMPRALKFWKLQRKKPFRAQIESGPYDWFRSSAERIPLDERIQSLEQTLDAHLRKIGRLRELLTKMINRRRNLEDQKRLIEESCQLLDHAFSSSGIVRARKGEGIFKSLPPLGFSSVRLGLPTGHLGAIHQSNDVMGSLENLLLHLKAFRRAENQFLACFPIAMEPCLPPSNLRRRWWQVSLVLLCAGSGAIWVVNNQKEFREALKTVQLAFQDFLTEHMIEPLEAIFGEVFLNQKPIIQDPAALLDTKLSLQRMLADFARDAKPDIAPSELQRIMDDMDMSVVSLQYEKQLSHAVRNLMSGEIVRMLLIQVQFIKKELMVAMRALDDVMHTNQLNLQMMATLPTFIAFGGLYTLFRNLLHQIYKRTSESLYYDPADVAGMLRNNLRDIERLLNKQNRQASTPQEYELLNERDLGLLILLLHQLHDLFRSHRMLFEEDVQERFEEDLSDLIDEGQLVSQQLAVIQRMYHTHPFLHRTKVTSRWLLG